MKKRAVSPVIATVLLIALVTAAAAIVFLVVIPMLRPGATPYFVATGSSAVNGTHRSISVSIEARGGDLVFNNVTCEQVPILEVSNLGASIAENNKITVIIKGTFEISTEYTFTFSFTSGGSTFESVFEHTA